MNWNQQIKFLRPALLTAALLGRLWLPIGAMQMEQWILGDRQNPVSVACAAFEAAIVQGGSVADGLAAFCDGISGNETEH